MLIFAPRLQVCSIFKHLVFKKKKERKIFLFSAQTGWGFDKRHETRTLLSKQLRTVGMGFSGEKSGVLLYLSLLMAWRGEHIYCMCYSTWITCLRWSCAASTDMSAMLDILATHPLFKKKKPPKKPHCCEIRPPSLKHWLWQPADVVDVVFYSTHRRDHLWINYQGPHSPWPLRHFHLTTVN